MTSFDPQMWHGIIGSTSNFEVDIRQHCTFSLQWSHNERTRLKPLAFRLFTQLFVQVQINENIKAPRHWSLGKFTGDRWFPHTVTLKMVPFHDVIMWWPGPASFKCIPYADMHTMYIYIYIYIYKLNELNLHMAYRFSSSSYSYTI